MKNTKYWQLALLYTVAAASTLSLAQETQGFQIAIKVNSEAKSFIEQVEAEEIDKSQFESTSEYSERITYLGKKYGGRIFEVTLGVE